MAEAPALRGVIIGDQIRWLDTPGSFQGDVAALPGQQAEILADLTKRYVTGGKQLWLQNWIRSLPQAVDDVTRDFGIDLYDRMLLDANCAASAGTFKAAVLEDGLRLMPAIDDKTDPRYALAQEIHQRAERMLEALPGGINNKLWNLLDACTHGNKVAEQTFTLDRAPSGRQRLDLTDLQVKPANVYAFAVDLHLNVMGLLGLVPGIGIPVQVGTLLASPEKLPNFLPRDKFVIHSFRPKDEDPRGSSLLRPAFTAWNLKQQLWSEYLRYLTQFATPSLIGTTAPQAMAEPERDPNGGVLLDQHGNPILLSPETVLARALADIKNSTALAFPSGTEVTALEMRGQGNPILAAFQYLSEQITLAILYQTLTTTPAQHAGLGSSQSNVHENVFETVVQLEKIDVQRLVRQDLLMFWVERNEWQENATLRLSGEDLRALAPRPSLGQTEEQDWGGKANGYATLASAGLLDESQYVGIDEELGLPARAEDWQEQKAQRQTAIQGQMGQLNEQMRRRTGVAVTNPQATPPSTETA